MRILVTLISICFIHQLSFAQIDSLTKDELKDWKTILEDKFYDYDNYLINILDRNAQQNDRRISEVRAEYFFSPRATITDLFPDNQTESHNRTTYIKRIATGVKTRHILSRQRKVIDISDFKIMPGTGIVDNNLDKQYRRYIATIYFYEKLFYSPIADDPDVDPSYIEEAHSLKKMRFILSKSEDPLHDYFYEMYCDGVELPNANSKEYKSQLAKLKINEAEVFDELVAFDRKIKRKNLDTKLLTNEEKKEFEERLIDSSFVTDLKDTLKVENPPDLNFTDYVLIGKGHFKAGRNGFRQVTGGLYMGGFLASCGVATYFKLKSNEAYSDHLNSNTIIEIDKHYEIANDNHHKFLFGVAAAGVIAIASAVHLKLKSSHSKRRYQSILEQNELIKKENANAMDVDLIGFSDYGKSGLSLRITF